MRLEFNYVIVDDDWSSKKNKRRVEKLKKKLNEKIISKGFYPNPKIFSSLDEFNAKVEQLDVNRFDLYLSDNNLGQQGEKEHENDGIELYLELYEKFPCDFLLYTGSTREKIIDKITDYMKKNDGQIFSRFSFVTRSTDPNDRWEDKVCEVIDIIISRREEMNTLRGIYAQETSRLHQHLLSYLNCHPDTGFKKVIDELERMKSSYSLTTDDIVELHHIRRVRNGILHNDERQCSESDEPFTYYLVYFADEDMTQEQRIYLEDFNDFRTKLREICRLIMKKVT